MTVGLFGGSFDPVHHGHLIVAQVLLETLGLEQLRFVPAREQPFKQGQHAAPAEDRLAMLRLAVAGRPGFAIETIELERPGPSYTVDTLRLLRVREPGVRFVLLVGADAAREIDAWHEAAAIPALAPVVAFARHGVPPVRSASVQRTVTVPALEISATEIRRRAREGRPLRAWVPDPVAEYIAAHRLYLE